MYAFASSSTTNAATGRVLRSSPYHTKRDDHVLDRTGWTRTHGLMC